MLASRAVLLAIPGLTSQEVHPFLLRREQFSAQPGLTRGEAAQAAAHLLKAGKEHLALLPEQDYTISAEGITEKGARAFRQALIRVKPDPHRPYSILAWTARAEPLHRMSLN